MNPAEEVSVVRAGASPTLPARELWRYRELLLLFVWRDLKVRYKQTTLGALWAVLNPFSTMLVFALLFGRLGRMPTDGLPVAIFYFSGLLPWTYLAQCANQGALVLVNQQNLISKVYFPRALIPLACAATPLLDLAIALVALAGLLAWYGVAPTPRLLALPALLAYTTVLGASVTLAFSALNARYRDLRQVLALVVQLWLFASPVAYPLSMIPGEVRLLYAVNPAVLSVEGLRWAVTGTSALTTQHALAGVGAAALLLLASAWCFRRIERQLADVL